MQIESSTLINRLRELQKQYCHETQSEFWAVQSCINATLDVERETVEEMLNDIYGEGAEITFKEKNNEI